MGVTLIQVEAHHDEPLNSLLTLAKQTFLEAYGHRNTVDDMQLYIDTHFNTTKLSNELNNPNCIFYFATVEDVEAGYIKVNKGETQSEQVAGNVMELERIYVLQEYQGKKIGALLLNKAIEIARYEKMDFLWLGVWAENKNAISFYEKHGFVIYDTHQFTLGTDVQTDFMMKLVL
jgi:diamine N-acetyltransferase